MEKALAAAIEALQRGDPVMIYDAEGREEETDLTFASQHVDDKAVRMLRGKAGGLVCTTMPDPSAQALGLPLLEDVLAQAKDRFPALQGLAPGDLRYDRHSSFSLTVNHRETFTGITDRDRALTISRFARLLGELDGMDRTEARQRLGREFRTPGHVFLLRAAPRLVQERRGHTELATALVTMAALVPSATICEMLDGGDALSKADAKQYAKAHHLPFLEGRDIIGAWERWSR